MANGYGPDPQPLVNVSALYSKVDTLKLFAVLLWAIPLLLEREFTSTDVFRKSSQAL